MSNKYNRQIILLEIGVVGQQKLTDARVLVIGCGGLGSPVADYLVRAGIGTLGLVDNDIIDETNLHRQILFTGEDIGKSKVDVAKQRLFQVNNQVKINAINKRVTESNISEIAADYDMVVDGSDNFRTRYAVNDYCKQENKTLVYGAVNKWEGQLTVFHHKGGPGLRDLFPEMPEPGTIENCEEAGVAGPLPGMIGSYMALEVIKLICDIGEVLSGRLMLIDGLYGDVQFIRYGAIAKPQTIKSKSDVIDEVDWNTFREKWEGIAELIDVRTIEERIMNDKGGIHVPSDEIETWLLDFENDKPLAFYCATGLRAYGAARLAQSRGIKSIVVI